MARRSFSFMLAWRYLNPRRALLSAVTLISVTGVLLGVLVLVVVMSVYTGLEKKVKERVLGFTPHVRVNFVPDHRLTAIDNWREIANDLKKAPHVQSATPVIQDYVLMVSDVARRPVSFKAVDTEDPEQVKSLQGMLDSGYPESRADMGMDDYVIVSSNLASQTRMHVGDKIRFFSAKNLDEAEKIDKLDREPPLRLKYADELAAAKAALKTAFESRGDKVFLSDDNYNEVVTPLGLAYADNEGTRPQEIAILERFAEMLKSVDVVDGGALFEKTVPAEAGKVLAELDTTNVEEMNAENAKRFREIILPKEATVYGVYQASQMMLTPDVLMPLHLAQNLSGLDDGVQGIGLRIDDPYQAVKVAEQIQAGMPEGWVAGTWLDELGEISKLLNQQRAMMYFVLSFIMIISAFSMMAVMFTTTIQKRREIGVMKALGAAPGQIVGVFLNQGMILGFIGSLLGVGLGLLVIRFIKPLQEAMRVMGFDPFSKSFIGVDGLPAEVNPTEVVIIAVSAFVLCTLAALVPAYFASRSDAAKSLRNL
ncbi:FtsX-like permease family protein [Haloferula sp. BvORR071]|uniref:ABC transporter permease n=1 Tax=Haloferula sp. BvORR071 TaxID=1396141 RepID=UPI0005595181|nr:FtsX-like permease family protein [Haloferula sp. BvORR071]